MCQHLCRVSSYSCCVCCYLVVSVCLFVSLLCDLHFQDAGDFAAVAYFVLRNRCPERGK